MKKSVLLLAAGSVLLSGCDMDGVFIGPSAPSPYPLIISIAFTQKVIEKCDSFIQGDLHPYYFEEDANTLFLSSKEKGRQHHLNQGTNDVGSYLGFEAYREAGTYSSIRKVMVNEKYILRMRCKKTGEIVWATAEGTRSGYKHDEHKVFITDIVNGKLQITTLAKESDIIRKRPSVSKDELVKIWLGEMKKIDVLP